MTKLRVDFTAALMMYKPALGTYSPVAPKDLTWYLDIPDAWLEAPDLAARVHAALGRIFRDINKKLHAREPTDINYLAALSSNVRLLDVTEVAERPWLRQAISFEPSCCFAIDESGNPEPLPREKF